MRLLLLAALQPALVPAKGPKTILSVIIDDMGWYDSQPHNPTSPTPTLGQWAKEGILLERHYVYTYCSPTRRSFVTGRFPVHISGFQADICSNWTPLNMTLLSQKLALAGFQSHFVGKTNLGFATTDHLPVNRGFTSHLGYMYGMEDYHYGRLSCAYRSGGPGGKPMCPPGSDPGTLPPSPPIAALNATQLPEPDADPESGQPPSCQPYSPHCIPNHGIGMNAHTTAEYFTHDFWHDHAPAPALARELYYSTNFYTEYAIGLLKNASASAAARLWIHLCYQAVHGPFEEVPEWEQLRPPSLRSGDRIYGDMLGVMDRGLGNITVELKSSGAWDAALIVMTSDNGGPTTETGPNNYPLRGSKESPWDGGTRVAAMVSGGYLSPGLRGTVSHGFMHVADWYATLSTLVGVDPSDVYDGHDVDSLDMWPLITGQNATNPREFLPVTEQTIIWKGQYKYHSESWSIGFNGWSMKNNTMTQPPPASDPRGGTFCSRCLFDLLADEGEHVNIAADHPEIVEKLAAQLATYRYYTQAAMSAEEMEGWECVAPPLTPQQREGWPKKWPWVVPPSDLPPPPPPPPAPPPVPAQAVRFDRLHKGQAVAVATDGAQAKWQGCNELALIRPHAGSDDLSRFWVSFGDAADIPDSVWIDVGFCSPAIPLNLSGSSAPDWMGDQVSAAGRPLSWIYRASGLFRAAAAVHDPGKRYGKAFGASANVSAVRHSDTELEFAVDGVSQGRVTLAASEALPPGAVGCVGVCQPITATVAPGGFPSRTGAGAAEVFAGPCCRRRGG